MHVAFAGGVAAFNMVFATKRLREPRSQVAELLTVLGEIGAGHYIYVLDGPNDAAEEEFRSRGYRLIDTEPWMAWAQPPPGAREGSSWSPVPPVEVRRVTDSATLGDHLDLAAAAFGLVPAEIRAAFPESALELPGSGFWTGWLDGEPVARKPWKCDPCSLAWECSRTAANNWMEIRGALHSAIWMATVTWMFLSAVLGTAWQGIRATKTPFG